jgi:tRNA A22 N-methylase
MEHNYTSEQIKKTLNFINYTLDNPIIFTNDTHIYELLYLISNIDDTNLLKIRL